MRRGANLRITVHILPLPRGAALQDFIGRYLDSICALTNALKLLKKPLQRVLPSIPNLKVTRVVSFDPALGSDSSQLTYWEVLERYLKFGADTAVRSWSERHCKKHLHFRDRLDLGQGRVHGAAQLMGHLTPTTKTLMTMDAKVAGMCCWCCAWFTKHVQDERAGIRCPSRQPPRATHGYVLPWVPPKQGMSLNMLRTMKSILQANAEDALDARQYLHFSSLPDAFPLDIYM